MPNRRSAVLTSRFVPRVNLLVRTLFIGVIPILLLTTTYLFISSQSNAFYFSQMLQDSAKQLAISIGSSVQRENFAALSAQLNILTQQPNVGFIYVQTIVTEEFKVKAALRDHFDLIVIKALHNNANLQPNQQLLWTDDASGYQQLLEFKRNTVASEIPRGVAAELNRQIAAAAGRSSNTYQISQVGVYETPAGRSFGAPDKRKAQFLITIGMIVNRNVAIVNAQNRNLVLFGVGFALLSILVSVVFTRSISVPMLALIRAADDMSLGRLERKIEYAGSDEIGQLARALERLRVSLDIVLKKRSP